MKKQGFTLIELLVVISIIGVLMGLLLVAFQGTRKSARDGKRKADLEQIRAALEMYRSDKGYYPNGGSASTWSCWINSTSGCSLYALVSGGYIAKLPYDPINLENPDDRSCGKQFFYAYAADAADGKPKTYQIAAAEELKGTTGCQCRIYDWLYGHICLTNP